jgi:hypothetical protein
MTVDRVVQSKMLKKPKEAGIKINNRVCRGRENYHPPISTTKEASKSSEAVFVRTG